MLNLVILYPHGPETNEMRQELIRHLAVFTRSKSIEIFDDTDNKPWDQFKIEIKKAIEKADIIIFLISSHYFQSDFIHSTELPYVRSIQEQRDLKLIFILTYDCAYEYDSLLNSITLLPRDEGNRTKAIADWPSRDRAWTTAVRQMGLTEHPKMQQQRFSEKILIVAGDNI